MKQQGHKAISPPEWGVRFLRWFCAPDLVEVIEGDLYEEFIRQARYAGERKARWLYWFEVLGFLKPRYIKRNHSDFSTSSLFSHDMIRNYFKIAFRSLSRNKGYSAINIGGLAIGMAVAILIGLWVFDEISFNRYHQNYKKIGQVMIHNGSERNGTYDYLPIPLAGELKSSFPDDFKYVVLSSGSENHIISSDDKKFTQTGSYMEAAAPDLLTLNMRGGTRAGLIDQNSILLAATLAKKLFGNTDPIDKILTIDNKSKVRVTGVYEDLPNNSTFKNLTFLLPWELMVSTRDWVKGDLGNWNDNSFHIFVQLAENGHTPRASFSEISLRIKDLERRYISKEKALYRPELFVHPMDRWHLYSNFENRVIVTSESLKFVWFYGLTGIFVLLIACINFMNLSTARSEKRAKEVGIRKAVGSLRSQLINQFFCESLLTAGVSFLLGILLVLGILPWFNSVADKTISIPFTNIWFLLMCLAFTAITGILAGSYPALYLSSFNPIKVLKGSASVLRLRIGSVTAVPRKVLVVFQFTASMALIIGTIIVYKQIGFAKKRPVGYTRQGLMQIRMGTSDFQERYEILASELKNSGVVSQVAKSSGAVTGAWSNSAGFEWKGKNPSDNQDFVMVGISYEYGKTIGLQFTEGRDFFRSFASDSSGFIINEAAAKYMGLKNPVGETVKWNNSGENINKDFRILGVVRDLVMNSPFENVKPTIFYLADRPGYISIRIDPQVGIAAALPKIESVFKSLIPSAPFDYSFVDDVYASKFIAEERVGNLAVFFSALAIFISALGLFGLSAFVAEQRTKEIGIRKVLGASVTNLWRLLSKDFVIMVIVSCLIATPFTYYFMDEWLQKYTYRTEISPWIFVLSGAGALCVTLLTVSYQAIRAAWLDPVKSLRNE
ncbi:FtsX-like permease family protein [Dyadobacter frigoris]|uniref:FtsX-like permease family protein n=1 Tax=Dyadobacter frigoris TaxID=2576211 RepID=A0A4U6CWM7_9BACT|nr:FtsX-like permease family protein [Dyadobacter frigoris]TKT87598.1 FtsX-like permease family protein [Dyadobacter frigoris]GLU52657.1 ABC transporter permease [Dyadobacter frigoris]